MRTASASSRPPLLLPRPRSVRFLDDLPAPPPDLLGRALSEPEARLGAAAPPRSEGYRIVVLPDRIEVRARDAAGLFRARQTLTQMDRLARTGQAIPCLEIEDWPDFPVRGVMLDISRDKVPRMETLLGLTDRLAEWKINHLQLYMEHTFAYPRHPEVWAQASPMTGEEIERLDGWCRERLIELVPNQNSFGHMERWLRHPRYRDLAEVTLLPEEESGAPAPAWRSLCPTDPRALDLIAGLYDDLLPHFSSRQLNVGLDETLDVGTGRSRDAVRTHGVGRVYLDFLLAVHRLVSERGRRMQFWGDIVLSHPDLIRELPRDVIALDWGYEADHPFELDGRRFAEAGIPHYVCPGTSAWLSLAGRAENAFGNLRSAAQAGLAHGAGGLLVTDWGDRGHWQPLPVSFPALAYGAALAWCEPSNRDLDVPAALDAHAFFDAAGEAGRAAVALGKVYLETGVTIPNASVLALLLLEPDLPLDRAPFDGLSIERLDAARFAADRALSRIERARMARADAELVVREWRLSAAMVGHACSLGAARLRSGKGEIERIPSADRRLLAEELDEVMTEYRSIWIERNRPGGLDDSVGRMERLGARYRLD